MQAAQFQHNVPVAIWSLWCQLLRCHLAQNKASATHQLLLLAMASRAPVPACLSCHSCLGMPTRRWTCTDQDTRMQWTHLHVAIVMMNVDSDCDVEPRPSKLL